MANIKSAKKQARQAEVNRKRNFARKTAVKNAIKKVMTALEQGLDIKKTQELLKEAEAKVARARGKGLLHSNTAARKIGRLAHKVAVAAK
jgi:small subunit ribosomal protein S20